MSSRYRSASFPLQGGQEVLERHLGVRSDDRRVTVEHDIY